MAHARLLPCVVNAVSGADLRRSAGVERKNANAGRALLPLSKWDSRNAIGRPNCKSTTPKERIASNVIRCSSSSASIRKTEHKHSSLEAWDLDPGQRTTARSCAEFKLSDFELCSHVSVGLAGKGDEVLFEGLVRNPESPLKGMRVVLRQLESRRAQLWGQRALQVLSRLVPREDSHLSYATRVHGYIRATGGGSDQSATLTLVHGYNGSYSLHQWLHSEDWLSELETRLSLDEDAVRRIGDDRTGGPAVSRQLRLVRILMRDLLIGVNYLHSRGYAHTQLRLQNLQVSEADKHVKVGLLGNAAAFPDGGPRELEKGLGAAANVSKSSGTRQLMIAYDMRCVGFIMAKMVLRELMDPSTFALFRNFLTQGNDPAGLREMFISLVNRGSPSDYRGIQLLDRDGGAGWNLLACLLAIKPTDRISCKDALRHPFLCGPMWRVAPTVEMTRWSVGSTIVRIVEEYIYGLQQRNRLDKLVDILERMNPNNTSEGWAKSVHGTWRLLHHTGRQIGLTTRAASPGVTIGGVTLTFTTPTDRAKREQQQLSMTAEVKFTAMSADKWPHDDEAAKGFIRVRSPAVSLTDGQRFYTSEESHESVARGSPKTQQPQQKPDQERSRSQRRARQHLYPEEATSLPIVRVFSEKELEMHMELDRIGEGQAYPQRVLHEVRRQLPRELFDLTGLVCATYIDSRLMVLRGITGSACLFSRSQSIQAAPVLPN